MQRTVGILVGLVIGLLGLTVLPVSAAEILQTSENGNALLATDQPTDDTVIAVGQSVDIRGTVARNAFLAGQLITIDNTVGGDVVAAGQTVTVKQPVSGNAFLAGQTILIEQQASVGRGIYVGGQTLQILGTVHGDVYAGGASVVIGGTVDGNLHVSADSLSLEPGAVIHGDITGSTGTAFSPANGAIIDGTVTLSNMPTKQSDLWHKRFQGLGVGSLLIALLMMILWGAVLFLVIPKPLAELRGAAYTKPGRAALIGLIASLTFVPAVLLLILPVITLPVALMFALVGILVAAIGKVIASIWVGDVISKQQLHPVWSLVVGATILAIVNFVPFIGWLLVFGAFTVGVGVVTTALWQWLRRVR